MEEISIFSFEYGGKHMLVLVSVIIFLIVTRLITDKNCGFRNVPKHKYKLLSGMLLLGIAYMISGFGMEGYAELAKKNIFFGFLQLASLSIFYLLLITAVKWDEAPANYLGYVGTFVGLVLLAELINVYITQEIIVDGVLTRELIATGWGIHNNIGGMMAMMLPFPFLLACKTKYPWLGIFSGSILFAGIILTTSRSSILVGSVIFLVCIVLTLIFSRHKLRVGVSILALLAVIAVSAICYWDYIASLIQYIAARGWDSSGRDEIYTQGIIQFLRYPIFGGTFYPTDYFPWDYSSVEAFSAFFPPRWHNTVIQLLACCGTVGLGAYIFHCVQVFRVFIQKASLLKTFIAISVIALMATSMLDCHFFNIGPVLFYSMALAIAEESNVACIRGKFEKSSL